MLAKSFGKTLLFVAYELATYNYYCTTAHAFLDATYAVVYTAFIHVSVVFWGYINLFFTKSCCFKIISNINFDVS